MALWGPGGDTAGRGALRAHPFGASLLSVSFPAGLPDPQGSPALGGDARDAGAPGNAGVVPFCDQHREGEQFVPTWGCSSRALGGVGGPSHLEDRSRQWVWFNLGMEEIPAQLVSDVLCSPAAGGEAGRGRSSFLLPPWPGKFLECHWTRGAGPSSDTKEGLVWIVLLSILACGALQESCQDFRESLLAPCPGRCSDTDVSWGWRNVHPPAGIDLCSSSGLSLQTFPEGLNPGHRILEWAGLEGPGRSAHPTSHHPNASPGIPEGLPELSLSSQHLISHFTVIKSSQP